MVLLDGNENSILVFPTLHLYAVDMFRPVTTLMLWDNICKSYCSFDQLDYINSNVTP